MSGSGERGVTTLLCKRALLRVASMTFETHRILQDPRRGCSGARRSPISSKGVENILLRT